MSKGEAGPPGATGATGATGTTGAAGAEGATGARGQEGSRGERGQRALLPRTVKLWFIGLSALFIIMLFFLVRENRHSANLAKETREIADRNSVLIRSTQELAERTEALSEENARLTAQARLIALQGEEAHKGICAYKKNLKRGIDRSETYLKENPNGVPGIPSLSAKVIQRDIADQKDTLGVLSVVHCNPD